jgi:hypothetical protein
MCAIAAVGLIASWFTVEHTLEQLEHAVEETKVESSSSGEER